MKHRFVFILLLQSSLVSANALSDRLASFFKINFSKGQFVETWNADYLDEPLISKGELRYIRPSQLVKFITYPEKIEQRIVGDQLSIIRDGNTHNIRLTEQPKIAVGIYALQAVLDGDGKKIHKFFKIDFKELDTTWSLSLTPRNEKVKESIEKIVLSGKRNRIKQVSIQFYNGDSLLTEITHRD